MRILRMLYRAIATLAIISISQHSYGQAPLNSEAASLARKHWTVSFYLENDLFADTDESYTSGVGLNWISPDTTDYLTDPHLPEWVRWSNKQLEWFYRKEDSYMPMQHNLVITLAQKMFTPRDPKSRTLITDDRPYAGWLYLGFGYHARNQDMMDSVEIDLGLVGPASLAEEAQDFIHDLRGSPKFEGWGNQLHNEPGLQIIYEHKRKIATPRNSGDIFGLACDAIGHTGFSLGNVAIYLNGGGELRCGWNTPDDFGTSSLRPGGNNSAPASGADSRLFKKPFGGLHVFTSLDGRLVARDIFLDGNTFRHSHRVDKRYAVGDAAVGISGVFYGVKLSFSRVYSTRIVKGQDGPHSYGSFAVSYTHNFD